MKYAKVLGLLAIVAAALMAFAGSVSATTLTNPKGTVLGVATTIEAESTHTELTGTINITCSKSTVKGEITEPGGLDKNGLTQLVKGKINTLTFTECINHTVTVNKTGTLSIESIGGGTGTLRSTGAEVTVLTHSLFLGTRHCIYVTNNTHIGTVRETGHKENALTGGTLTIASAPIDQTATDGLCGADAKWDGDYKVTKPQHLYID